MRRVIHDELQDIADSFGELVELQHQPGSVRYFTLCGDSEVSRIRIERFGEALELIDCEAVHRSCRCGGRALPTTTRLPLVDRQQASGADSAAKLQGNPVRGLT